MIRKCAAWSGSIEPGKGYGPSTCSTAYAVGTAVAAGRDPAGSPTPALARLERLAGAARGNK